MAQIRRRPKAVITTERGQIYVDGLRFDATFRYPYWLWKVNPHLLLPGLRRDHRKIIYINGKRFGKADYREGCIPLPSYRIKEEYFSDKLTNFVREVFGLGCSRGSRGYYNIKLRTNTYVVIVRKTSAGYVRCIVYCRDTYEYVGDFLFDSEMTVVHPRLALPRLERTFCVIVGYILDSLVYATVARQLDRKLEIHC